MSELFPAYRASWEIDQHGELRRHAAEFLRKESTPNQQRWAKNHQVDREFWNKLGDAGLLGLDLPEEFGGTGGDFGYSATVGEELALAHDTATGGPCIPRSSRITSTPTATTHSGTVVDRCVQFFGGYGYMMEYPIALAYAAARVNKIYGGTSEIMKEIISRSL